MHTRMTPVGFVSFLRLNDACLRNVAVDCIPKSISIKETSESPSPEPETCIRARREALRAVVEP